MLKTAERGQPEGFANEVRFDLAGAGRNTFGKPNEAEVTEHGHPRLAVSCG